MMNRTATAQELEEASIAIDELIEAIRAGEHDQDSAVSSLAYKYQHILCHLARSWHYRNLTDGEIDQLTQEQFDELSYSVPDWGLTFKVVDPDWKLDSE